MKKELYLKSLFRRNKFLFLVAILFILMIAYAHKTNLNISPAFITNMYFLRVDAKTDSFLYVVVNGQTTLNLTHTYDEPRRSLIYFTLQAYHAGMLNGEVDPSLASIDRTVNKHPFLRGLRKTIGCRKEDYEHYLPWLLRYLQTSVSDTIKKLDIGMTYLHYNERNLPVVDSTKHLYHIE